MPFRYPIVLELAGRRCVVVGGGSEAERKARALLDAGASVLVVAADVTPGLAELERQGQLTRQARSYRRGDLDGTFLVVSCEPEHNAAVFAHAEAAGVLCNAVDDVPHCHFAAPSVLRRGDLVVAVSTGGRAPALSKRLRRRLADQFGPEYATLVDLLAEARSEALADRPSLDFSTWAARWESALDGTDDLIGLIATGGLEEARARLRAALRPQRS
ncbi:MAG: precorrin-2 dehydrogenase/sirohydrochlorin ferrochelatase family protein [Acidimicrobiia bacterium]